MQKKNTKARKSFFFYGKQPASSRSNDGEIIFFCIFHCCILRLKSRFSWHFKVALVLLVFLCVQSFNYIIIQKRLLKKAWIEQKTSMPGLFYLLCAAHTCWALDTWIKEALISFSIWYMWSRYNRCFCTSSMNSVAFIFVCGLSTHFLFV